MSDKHLNIISFDVPYPPDYGGAIDVFYKIKILAERGVKIHLHCFQYRREKQPALEEFCEEVIYYKRDKMWKGFLTDKPFIVHSRNSPMVRSNLKKNNYPVLFEGLHCCYYLNDNFLKGRLKIVRMHNNEAQYYFDLAKREKSIKTKLYFYEEFRRLLKYEYVLQYADNIFCISKAETEHYSGRFKKVSYLAPFHGNNAIRSQTGKGNYVLYHGNLSVNENNEAALFLVNTVFKGLDVELIIAGNNPSQQLTDAIKNNDSVRIIINPDKTKMDELIAGAHINLLPAFQNTGIKLKLVNALFNGRFCIVNSIMVENSELEKYCIIADQPDDIREKISELMNMDFGSDEILKRKELETIFSDKAESEKIIQLL